MAGEGGERNYYCPHGCGRLVLITAARNERVRGVYCRKCQVLVTVNLEGYGERNPPQAGGGVVAVGKADPRNPPIETMTIKGARGGRG